MLDSGDHSGVAAATLAIEDPYTDESHVLGDAVSRAPHCACDVRAVAVAVGSVVVVIHEVITVVEPRSKLVRARVVDAGIDDVHVDAGSVRAPAILPIEAVPLVDSIESP